MLAESQMLQERKLLSLESCFNIRAKQSLDAWVASRTKGRLKRRILCWMIRTLYNQTDFSGDFRLHDMGTLTDEDVAKSIVAMKNSEAKLLKPGDKGYGFVWEYKASPVNRLLSESSVQYGAAEYSGTAIDSKLRARKPTELVECDALQQIKGNLREGLKLARDLNKTLQASQNST
jgi:hypothetical protein